METEQANEKGPETAFIALKARAYHINQEAIEVCNRLELAPAEAILSLETRLIEVTATNDRLQKIVPEGRPVYSLEEFQKAMRTVVQGEGVMLHNQQKEFFRNLNSTLVQAMSDSGRLDKP